MVISTSFLVLDQVSERLVFFVTNESSVNASIDASIDASIGDINMVWRMGLTLELCQEEGCTELN
jgi:hypothetical protein